MCRHHLARKGSIASAIVIPLLTAAWLAPPLAAHGQTVNGNSKAGPLTAHIYALRIGPPGNDLLPYGLGVQYYMYSVYDTGANGFFIDTTWDAVWLDPFDPLVPMFLDVRLWGHDAVDPITLEADLDSPEAEVEDVAIDVAPVGAPTLVGGPVTNQTLAHVDYPNLVTRGSFTYPAAQFYDSGAMGIPTPLMWADLTPFGSTAPAPNGTSRGQRYYLSDATFEHGGSDADSTTYDFLYDTGNTTTQISEPLASALGINLLAVVDTITINGEVLNGYLIDRFSIQSSNGAQEYVIEVPLVFVKPPPAFGGAADANIGTNFFETTQILFDGPGARLGVNKAIPLPEPGAGALAAGVALLLALGRRRVRS